MITKGKQGLVWVFNEHLERTVNAMVIFTSRKYMRQTCPVPFFCGMGHTGPIIGKHPEGHDALSAYTRSLSWPSRC